MKTPSDEGKLKVLVGDKTYQIPFYSLETNYTHNASGEILFDDKGYELAYCKYCRQLLTELHLCDHCGAPQGGE